MRTNSIYIGCARRYSPHSHEHVFTQIIVGARAMLQCESRIARNDGTFRDCFKGLTIIVFKPVWSFNRIA